MNWRINLIKKKKNQIIVFFKSKKQMIYKSIYKSIYIYVHRFKGSSNNLFRAFYQIISFKHSIFTD